MISIVVPMYNAADYIGETIRAVQSQTYTDWELLLVDDLSTDDTLSLARRAAAGDPGGRIRVLPLERNGGAAKARNAGVEEARGDLLAFLDADDLWLPEKLEREETFLRQRDAAFVCHAYEFGDERARGTGKYVRPPERLTYEKALTRTVVFTSTVMLDLRKLTKQEVHMPDCPSEDTALWWRLMRSGIPCHGMDEVLAIYRRPPRSLSSNKGKAVKRIWGLYRQQEKLGTLKACACLSAWAVRATLRRL